MTYIRSVISDIGEKLGCGGMMTSLERSYSVGVDIKDCYTIVTTSTRIKQLVEEKTTPRNRDEQEIAGYRDVLNVIHESFDAIPITQNYILQLQKILYSHMNNPLAGRTKSVQNYISAAYPDGHTEILFTPLAPYETSEALDFPLL